MHARAERVLHERVIARMEFHRVDALAEAIVRAELGLMAVGVGRELLRGFASHERPEGQRLFADAIQHGNPRVFAEGVVAREQRRLVHRASPASVRMSFTMTSGSRNALE